ncbi:MAG TPA: hypothetical protein VM238_01010 [Phycisphaerae bacterium]|nr:hypothetical protein [Phycisphaerae bacterium]
MRGVLAALVMVGAYRLARAAEADGEKVETENLGRTGTARMTPSATKTANWRITFAK